VLRLFVVTTCKWPINPISNPKPCLQLHIHKTTYAEYKIITAIVIVAAAVIILIIVFATVVVVVVVVVLLLRLL
jgi:hypothetical protein